MVCINTQHNLWLSSARVSRSELFTRNKLRITHFVSVNSHYTIATAKEQNTNRTKVFLISRGKVYFREGISGNWLNERRASVYELIESALLDSSIPHYSTNNN